MKSLIAAVTVLGLGAWGCSSDDSGDTTTGTSTSTTTSTSTNTGAGGGGNTTSTSGATGGSIGSAGATAAGGATSTTVAPVTPTDCTAGDCSISAGEFSFFAVSLDYILTKAPGACTAGNVTSLCLGGLGGNLGGLAGADAICTAAAQAANPGDTHIWRAFLSTSTVNAIDRIGTGPWYSAPPKFQNKSNYASEGLEIAANKSELLQVRPTGAGTSTIVFNGPSASSGNDSTSYNWPFAKCILNEKGKCTIEDGDTHDTLTGSDTSGKYVSGGACSDWTSTSATEYPAFGHTWPRTFDATDKAANWLNTGEMGEVSCAAVINTGTSNVSCGGMGGPGGGSSSSTCGVGSAGGYGAFYCFATNGS